MAAEPGDAAAFIRDAPFDVVKAILVRLSPKWILRMRGVCKPWRDKLCMRALLTCLHREDEEPPRPLICFDRVACPDRDFIRLRDYRIESLDLRSGELHAVSRFTDNEGYGSQVTVHASLDGYLLVSFSYLPRWYIINPTTRHWASLFDPTTFGLHVVGFYEYGTSGRGNYRVLCRRNEAPHCTYHVVAVRPGERRHIGRPISPAVNDHGLRFGVERASISPSIQLKRNMDLLWPPQESQGYHILVFHTGIETFSWKRPPPPVTMMDDQDLRLLEFPDGDLGLSVSRENDATVELWCLQDYHDEVWVLRHRIELALQQMPPALQLREDPWIPAVVSAEGDVLIQSRHRLFHCDRGGNLLRSFWFDQPESSDSRVLPVRHVLRKSLVQHPMFRPSENDPEPPFFRWMSSDQTW